MSLDIELKSFANSIRHAKSDITESEDTKRRMNIYRSLFFNNVSGFIQNGFPVLRSLYKDEQWDALIRQFFIKHECSSPYFIHISKEFVEYLSNEHVLADPDPVFIAELAHYEWLELALSVRESSAPVEKWQYDYMPDKMKASELSEVAAYGYPVHQISRDFVPETSDSTFYYLLYRDTNYQVQFQHIMPLSAMAIQLLGEQEHSFESLIKTIHDLTPQFDPDTLKQGLQPLLQQWLSCGAVVAA